MKTAFVRLLLLLSLVALGKLRRQLRASSSPSARPQTRECISVDDFYTHGEGLYTLSHHCSSLRRFSQPKNAFAACTASTSFVLGLLTCFLYLESR